ncbi:LysM peptidoglycan-binding domain-containing protein [Fredinandcohnia sp. 179-A 10B2 NHS]|uniref:3D domain-containing protein n=1 Tax=Fredinandcohnia sp. 179-A 10B2 NHS TaxID=3235176 RepID=UPI00399F4924
MLKKMVSILAGTVLSVTVCANVQASTITVHKGDTLWDLSQTNNISVKNIKILNQLSTDLIHPGDKLTVASQKQYTVKKGDTLWDIARAHQISVSQIKEWNELHSDLIHPGLNLLIFEGIKPTKSIEETPVQSVADTTKESSDEEPVVKKEEESISTVTPATTSKASSKEIVVTATAYTATCEGCSGITSTGINLLENPEAKVISVDPSVIPLGSKVYVEGYGEAISGDTGGAIKGNKIDVFIPSKQDAINFGVKQVKVTILD